LRGLHVSLCFLYLLLATPIRAETLRLPATADVWLSHATPRESDTGAGGSPVFKLKSVQELAAIRFDLTSIRTRPLLAARLHLRGRGTYAPRWLRVSTVSSQWTEGRAERAYSGRDGASWNSPDIPRGTSWSWPGSSFCDVCMGAGNTEVHTLAVQRDAERWISVELPTSLVEAMACGISDGLALMEGGSPYMRNYYFQSAQSWEGVPWLELECADPSSGPPPTAPQLSLFADESRASLEGGATRVAVAYDSTAFAYRGWLDGKALESWQIPRPLHGDSTVFWLKDLQPSTPHTLSLQALSKVGLASTRTELSFRPSEALPEPAPLARSARTPRENAPARPPSVWAEPALAKLDPVATLRLDERGLEALRPWVSNAVWDGKRVRLAGARRETLSFQLVVQSEGEDSLGSVTIRPLDLLSVNGDTLSHSSFKLYSLWYVQRADTRWQPSYLVPFEAGVPVDLSPSTNGPARASNRCLFIELELPDDATPGVYRGALSVEWQAGGTQQLPIELELVNWSLPRTPGFRIELNAYHVPKTALSYFRIARQNRCVFTPWVLSPRLRKGRAGPSLDWSEYDLLADSLLTGSAFPDDPRPLEVLYLPFWESWPTTITPANYHYRGRWPKRGDPYRWMWDHPQSAPRIDRAFDASYLRAFAKVEGSFVDHFEQKGWNQTELHCFFGSKMRHRTDYGRSTWWNTDEPLYWTDWSALGFFLSLFDENLPPQKRSQWLTRADVSRPEWLEGALDSRARIVYTGGQTSAAQARRCRELARSLHFRWQVYGAVNQEDAPVSDTVAWIARAWLDGARGALVWLSLGNADSWANYDPDDAPGTALLLAPSPAGRGRVVGDLRLKALRDAQQLSEWLELLETKEGLKRPQMESLVRPFLQRGPTDARKVEPDGLPMPDQGFSTRSLEELRMAILQRLF